MANFGDKNFGKLQASHKFFAIFTISTALPMASYLPVCPLALVRFLNLPHMASFLIATNFPFRIGMYITCNMPLYCQIPFYTKLAMYPIRSARNHPEKGSFSTYIAIGPIDYSCTILLLLHTLNLRVA